MIFRKQVTLVLSALVLSIGGLTVAAQAKAQQCASAECACERALEENTAEALEAYLKKYQHDASSQETACAALGVPQEDLGAGNSTADYGPEIAQPGELPPE